MSEHTFCRFSMKLARNEAREKKIKIPRFAAWMDRFGYSPTAEITNWHTGEMIWSGQACCLYEAKCNAIHRYLPDED